jgi:hypothetical protein
MPNMLINKTGLFYLELDTDYLKLYLLIKIFY